MVELAIQLRRRIAAEEPDSRHRLTLGGQLAGLESDPAPADPGGPPDEPPLHRGGYAAGRVYGHLIRTFGALPAELLVPTAGYGSALTTEPVARALADGGAVGILKAHSAAAFAAAKRGGFPPEVELVLFRWLAWQRSIEVSPELLDRYQAWRTRRLARTTGTDRPPDDRVESR
jgi:hypothetical protein